MAIVVCKINGCCNVRVIAPLNNSYVVKGLCRVHMKDTPKFRCESSPNILQKLLDEAA